MVSMQAVSEGAASERVRGPHPVNPLVIDFSADQRQALRAVRAWLSDSNGPQRFVLGGLAGTGKTLLVSEIVNGPRVDALVLTPTGKAAHVLRQRGVDASTVHSQIYKVEESKRTGLHFRLRSEIERFASTYSSHRATQVIVVDEASMLSKQLVGDIESFGYPVLYVGDHGQLEPVGDDAGIMLDLDARLEQIHRQASGSGIIDFAHALRSGEHPLSTGVDNDVTHTRTITKGVLRHSDVIVCGFRRTRVKLNTATRSMRGFDAPHPMPGESVICLANGATLNNVPVFNGLTATVVSVNPSRMRMVVQIDGEDTEAEVKYWPPQFGAEETVDRRVLPKDSKFTLWDWAYAITAHKSQGSQWHTVAVYDETHPEWNTARWRYTAATRASERLIWITP